MTQIGAVEIRRRTVTGMFTKSKWSRESLSKRSLRRTAFSLASVRVYIGHQHFGPKVLPSMSRNSSTSIERNVSHDELDDIAFVAWSRIQITKVTQVLAAKSAADPTWGANATSSVHVARCLEAMGDEDPAAMLVFAVAALWDVKPFALPLPVVASVGDWMDFGDVGRSMRSAELMAFDLEKDPYSWASQTAAEINYNRAYRLWVAALMLNVPSRHHASLPIEACISILTRSQLHNGAFYPDRAPWLTAKVVLGFVEAGYDYESSEVVRRACDWLTAEAPSGPRVDGIWLSGATDFRDVFGGDAGTTALCAQALAGANSPRFSVIERSCSGLVDALPELVHKGRFVDAALAIEAVVTSGTDWIVVRSELASVVDWMVSSVVGIDLRVPPPENLDWSQVALASSSVARTLLKMIESERPNSSASLDSIFI